MKLHELRFQSLSCLIYLCKTLAFSGLFLYFAFLIFFTQSYWSASVFFSPLQHIFSPSQTALPPLNDHSTTNISHLVFGLVGSNDSWTHRRAYVELWWHPNVTRGYVYLNTALPDELLSTPGTSPKVRVSDDMSKLVLESRHRGPLVVRIVHAILEVFREGDQGVRWYVMGDDDTIFFVENWANVLAKYDHTKYIYIGGQSETLRTDYKFSFDAGFGGGGIALSYPLVSALVKNLEGCLKRYPYLGFSDFMTQHCVDELGVSLSIEKGIHQIDLRGDISGLLSSHPQAPLLSLHHLDKVAPIFPSMDRFQSVAHLMKSARVDQSRLLQQTICYHKPTSWSFVVSWGYSAHIYEKVIPRTILKRPLETFRPWSRTLAPPYYPFNTRPLSSHPCDAPHIFYVESVENFGTDQIVSTYVRSSPRGLPTCLFNGNHSADYVYKVRVSSPTTKLIQMDRSECCDIMQTSEKNMVEVQIRTCMDD